MDIRKLINNLLSENRKYEFGCVMLSFDFPQIKEIHDIIDDNDLYIDENDPSFGLEKDSHCTLLYGLHKDVTLNDVQTIINKQKFGEIKLHNPSCFNNDNYDVLKFDVEYIDEGENKFLHKSNEELKKMPHTSNFPNYHPHCTIAYIKKGLGNKYINQLNDNQLNEYVVTPSHVIYSRSNGIKYKINITLDV